MGDFLWSMRTLIFVNFQTSCHSDVYIYIEVSVHLITLHFIPDLHTYDIDLLLRVAQDTRGKSVSEGFETVYDREEVPGVDFFRTRISWLDSYRLNLPLSHDIHETSVFQPASE